MTISHATQRKISGALHEDTGIGFNKRTGPVYRKDLNGDFTLKNAKSIIDPIVQSKICEQADILKRVEVE